MSADDLFTARELTQMIPLFGRGTFDDLRAANRWLERYLPNAARATSSCATWDGSGGVFSGWLSCR